MKEIDINNMQFGRLTAIKRHDITKWECKCQCGKTIFVGELPTHLTQKGFHTYFRHH